MRARTINETISFERGRGAKRAVGFHSIERLASTQMPRLAEKHGWKQVKVNILRNSQILRFRRIFKGPSYGEWDNSNDIMETLSLVKHRHHDEINDKTEDGHSIRYILEFTDQGESFSKPKRGYEMDIRPSELWESSWWDYIDGELESAKEEL